LKVKIALETPQVVGLVKGQPRASHSREGTQGIDSNEDPGWESEVRVREEEVARYEERILVKEFRERLDFNTGKV
jgi:hypothetical protein